MSLIKEKGYDTVTLNNICAAANISKNTFYYYFESKEDLLLQFYKILNDISTRNLPSILMAETSVEQYWKMLEPILDFIVDNGTEITKRILYTLTNQNLQAFDSSKLNRYLPDVETTIVARAQASGEIRNTSDPFLLIAVAQAQFLGVISLWCTANGQFDLKNAVRLAIEVCFDVKPELRKAPTDVLSSI
jgi:AcrR family transcriptional regulator